MPRDIFVFGSNLAGVHGAGAAKFALKHHGAVRGQGVGLQGNSFAIPTKDRHLRTLPIDYIKGAVAEFLDFARERQDLTFLITPIGCGLAGYKRPQILPFFDGMPANCRLADSWAEEDTN